MDQPPSVPGSPRAGPFPVDRPGSNLAGEVVPEPRTDARSQRPEPGLTDLHDDLVALTRRVDALAESFDASLRQAVAEEVQKVAGELQHTVATLGRILVRDLGKLSQILAQHRDAILAELHQTPGSAGPGAPSDREGAVGSAAGLPDDQADTETKGTGTKDDGAGPPSPAGTQAPTEKSAARQWRGPRRRKA